MPQYPHLTTCSTLPLTGRTVTMARRRTAPQALPAGCRQGWRHPPRYQGQRYIRPARPKAAIQHRHDIRQCRRFDSAAIMVMTSPARSRSGAPAPNPRLARAHAMTARCAQRCQIHRLQGAMPPTYSNRNAPAKRLADISAQAISPRCGARRTDNSCFNVPAKIHPRTG